MQEDPVFLELTKPPLLLGVPYSFFGMNVGINILIFLYIGAFTWLFAGVLIGHAFGYVLALRDPRLFDLWINRIRNFPPSRNRKLWGGDSFAP